MLALRAVEEVVGSEKWKAPGMWNGDADAISQEGKSHEASRLRAKKGEEVEALEGGTAELVTEPWSSEALSLSLGGA